MTTTTLAAPPREQIVRAAFLPSAVRDAAPDSESGRPVLHGHFARFNEWTEIDSWEGRFLERIAPGAFKKTMRERTPKVLFNHGHDSTMGGQVIGDVESLREDGEGAYYEVRLFDGIPALLLDGLRAGTYGASFRFRVLREDMKMDPGASPDNPVGLPERTIKEAQVFEFGPVTFPAYEGATAGVRSDDNSLGRMAFFADALTQLIRSAPTQAPADEQIEEDKRSEAEAEPHLAATEEIGLPDPPAETAERVEQTTTDAPSTEGAGTESHPARERRVTEPRDPGDRSWIHGETTSKRSSQWSP